jgi:hypothetical protein
VGNAWRKDAGGGVVVKKTIGVAGDLLQGRGLGFRYGDFGGVLGKD